jgi:hypothetical protein
LNQKTQEVIRSPQDLPEVGEWYVLHFGIKMEYDIEHGRKTWNPVVELAPVGSAEPHGRDYRVTFDLDNLKMFAGRLDGELYTPAENVIKVLRRMADDMERAVRGNDI